MSAPNPYFEGRQRVPRAVTVGFLGAVGVALIVVVVLALRHGEPTLAVLLLPALPAGVLFYTARAFQSLHVVVDRDEVRLAFGSIGPRKRIALGDIQAARPTRSRALYGWGIRWVPRGWMWNVWGLDAVELERRNARRFLIGTDRPAELAAAITQAVEDRAKPR